MNTPLSRFVRPCLLAALAAAAIACSGSPDGQGSAPAATATAMEAPVRIETIDAQRISALPGGENLVVDMSQPDVAYEFDSTAAPIDFSRVSLHFADGAEVSLAEWRAQTGMDGADVAVRNANHFFLRPNASEAPPVLVPEKLNKGVESAQLRAPHVLRVGVRVRHGPVRVRVRHRVRLRRGRPSRPAVRVALDEVWAVGPQLLVGGGASVSRAGRARGPRRPRHDELQRVRSAAA